MKRYKVTREFSYAGVAEVIAPNLEAAEELAKDIDGSEFIEQEDSGDSYIYSITQEDETVHCLVCDSTYPENVMPPIVKACPNCGNTDKNQTVFLSKEKGNGN